jgi:hypothetical protein
MIFFMTILIPSSNILLKLREMQKQLFERNIIIPSPSPLMICSVSEKKSNRPSRSLIADMYPSEIIPGEYKVVEENLLLTTNEPFTVDSNDNALQGIILGQINAANIDNSDYPSIGDLSFKNYSLASYEVQSDTMSNFWMNMSWIKLWEVQKKKI